MARKKNDSKTGGAEKNSRKTPLEAFTDRECFEAVTKAFLELAVDRELSSKNAFASARSVLRDKVGEIDLPWIRAFMRLMEEKRVVCRFKKVGKGKGCMLRLGKLTFRPSRRTRRVSVRTSTSPSSRNVRSSVQVNEGLGPMVDQKIANLEAELAKLKQIRDLLI